MHQVIIEFEKKHRELHIINNSTMDIELKIDKQSNNAIQTKKAIHLKDFNDDIINVFIKTSEKTNINSSIDVQGDTEIITIEISNVILN